MPSVTQQDPVLSTSKKRRRGENDNAESNENRHVCNAAVHYKRVMAFPRQHHYHAPDRTLLLTSEGQFLQNNDEHLQNGFFARKTPILPAQSTAKRLRMEDETAAVDHNPNRDQRRRMIASAYSLQQKTAHVSSRLPHEGLQQADHNSRPQLPARSISAPAPTTSALAPCHICQRRPTKKSDLDSFADCEGCGMRTCYVCIRECLGWDREEDDNPDSPLIRMEDVDDPAVVMGGNGKSGFFRVWPKPGSSRHRQMICRRCCIEEGADGDVMCLGCLQLRCH